MKKMMKYLGAEFSTLRYLEIGVQEYQSYGTSILLAVGTQYKLVQPPSQELCNDIIVSDVP